MEEVWRDVPEFGGVYRASINGIIEGYMKGRKELTQETGAYGKKRVLLYKDGIRHKMMVHVVMAKTYPDICGEWFEGCHVHHKDGNPSNNNAYNLQVLTKEEHIKIHYTPERIEIAKNNLSKMTEEQFRYGQRKCIEINSKKVGQFDLEGILIKEFKNGVEAANAVNCSVSLISKCCLGKKQTGKGYIWKFVA